MSLSPLASAIYDVLRPMVPSPDAAITYSDLAAELKKKHSYDLDGSDPTLHEALGEIVHACKAKQLPALPAMVVRKKEKSPGFGYYPVAHPAAKDDAAKKAAWESEIDGVRKATYPPSL